MALVKVEVRKLNIANAEIASAFNCPVAKAFPRYLREGITAGVTHEQVILRGTVNNEYFECRLNFPVEVSKKISSFDSDKKMKPFSFEIDIPDNYLKQ